MNATDTHNNTAIYETIESALQQGTTPAKVRELVDECIRDRETARQSYDSALAALANGQEIAEDVMENALQYADEIATYHTDENERTKAVKAYNALLATVPDEDE